MCSLVVADLLLYVASVGGDFMGLFRFALPVVPLVAVAPAIGLRAIARGPLADAERGACPSLGSRPLLAAYASRMRSAWIKQGARHQQRQRHRLPWLPPLYTDDRAAIGKLVRTIRQARRLRRRRWRGRAGLLQPHASLDCFGLSDEYIAHEVPPVDSRPGHQKYAPVDYQLSKHPTIITSNYYSIGAAPLARGDAAFWRRAATTT